MWERKAAVNQLGQLMHDRHPGLALAARMKLKELSEHDSKSLSTLACAELSANVADELQEERPRPELKATESRGSEPVKLVPLLDSEEAQPRPNQASDARDSNVLGDFDSSRTDQVGALSLKVSEQPEVSGKSDQFQSSSQGATDDPASRESTSEPAKRILWRLRAAAVAFALATVALFFYLSRTHKNGLPVATGNPATPSASADSSRGTCERLASRLCGEIGETTETCKLVKDRFRSFDKDRCDKMLARYPEVLADLKRVEESSKPLDAESQSRISTSDGPSFGPQNAKVTLVEFSDFQCPHSAKTAKTVSTIKRKFPEKIRFVFHQFPLSFHDKANLAAQAALAANAQGKFWEYRDYLFANQSELDRAGLEKAARSVGLRLDDFKRALDDKVFETRVNADMKLGNSVGVLGTPTVFINGKRFVYGITEVDLSRVTVHPLARDSSATVGPIG